PLLLCRKYNLGLCRPDTFALPERHLFRGRIALYLAFIDQVPQCRPVVPFDVRCSWAMPKHDFWQGQALACETAQQLLGQLNRRQGFVEKGLLSEICLRDLKQRDPLKFPAEILAAVGYPGAVDGYQVNFRVPSDTAKGPA